MADDIEVEYELGFNEHQRTRLRLDKTLTFT